MTILVKLTMPDITRFLNHRGGTVDLARATNRGKGRFCSYKLDQELEWDRCEHPTCLAECAGVRNRTGLGSKGSDDAACRNGLVWSLDDGTLYIRN